MKLVMFYNWHSHRAAVQLLTQELGSSVTYTNKNQYILTDSQIKKLKDNAIPFKVIKDL